MKLLFIKDEGWVICDEEDYNDTGGRIEIKKGKVVNMINIPRDAYDAEVAGGGSKRFFFVEHLNDQITTIAMLADLTNNITEGPILYRRETITKEAPPTEAFENWVRGTSAGIEIAQNLDGVKGDKIITFPG